jgi:hypothetical protein
MLVWVCTYTYIRMYMCMHVCTLVVCNIHTNTHVCLHVYMRVRIYTLSRDECDYKRGFGLVIGSIDNIQIVTTSNYNAVAN